MVSATVIILVVAILGLVVTARPSSYVPSQATGDVSCQTKVGNVQSGMINVYQVTVPSDAVVCASYSFNRTGIASFSNDYGPINGSSFNSCGARNGTEVFACQGLSITAFPSAASHLAGQTLTIAYKISASEGLKNGMYWLFIGSCSPIVLVVGPIPADISSWDTGAALSCISSLSDPATSQVAGVTNINVVSVPIK